MMINSNCKMTVKEFLANGYKFVGGDKYKGINGEIHTVGVGSFAANTANNSIGWTIQVIVSAKALDKPAEKQVMDFQTAMANSKKYDSKDIKISLRDKMLQRKRNKIKAQAKQITSLLADKKALKAKVFELNKTISDNVKSNTESLLKRRCATSTSIGASCHKAMNCEDVVVNGAEPEVTMEIEEDKLKAEKRVKTEFVKCGNCDDGYSFPELAAKLVDGDDFYYDNSVIGAKELIVDFETLLERYRINDVYRKVETEIKTEKRWVVFDGAGTFIGVFREETFSAFGFQAIEIEIDVE